MLDDIFSFIDPLVEVDEADMFHSTLRMVEVYFDLMDKKGVDRKKSLPPDLSDVGEPDVPLDIALSLLRPDELVKLKHYVTTYMAKYKDEAE